MKLKTSFFNSGIIKQAFKQHGWIGIIYLIGLIFALPLQIVMITSNPRYPYDNLQNIHISLIYTELEALFLFTVPVIAGIFLFRFMQVKEAADMLHSLPINRKSLFINHIFSGLLMLLPAILITAALTWLVNPLLPVTYQITATEIFSWIGIMTLLTTFLFIFSVFVGMITGMSVAQGILTYIFLFLPIGLIMLIDYNLNIFLYGYVEHRFSSIFKWSPLISFTELPTNPFTYKETIVYIVLTIAFFIGGYIFYKHRQLETVTQVITFNFLKPIFKYGIAFSTMLVIGNYFASQQNQHKGWLAFGYIIGTIIGYLIAEIVLQKTWRVFNLKTTFGFLIYAVLLLGLFAGIEADIIGYEKKVPALEEIEGAYLGNRIYAVMEDQIQNNHSIYSKDSSYIKNVRQLHKEILTKRPKYQEENQELVRNMVIAYKLKNGKLILREYLIPIELVATKLQPVMESEIYKQQEYRFSELDKPVDRIVFSPYVPIQNEFVITDPREIEELKQILKQDILLQNYKDMVDLSSEWANIQFILADNKPVMYSNYVNRRLYYEFKKSYNQLEKWLDNKGYFSKIKISPDDIKVIKVAKYEEKQYNRYPEELFSEIVNKNLATKVIKLEDKELIKEVLDSYSNYGYNSSTYYLEFTTIYGDIFYGAFTKENTPSFILQYFKD